MPEPNLLGLPPIDDVARERIARVGETMAVDELLTAWWATCTELERHTLALFLLVDRPTPSQVLDRLSGFAHCNFAVDRLRDAIDADLAQNRLLLSSLTLSERGALLEAACG